MTGLLVSEWIEPTGGAARVLDRLAALLPDADMLCLWNDAPRRYGARKVRETWLARTPLRSQSAPREAPGAPLRPRTGSQLEPERVAELRNLSRVFQRSMALESAQLG